MISRGFSKAVPGHPSVPSLDQSRAITVGSLNKPRAEVERLGRIRGGSGVVVTQTPGGPMIRLNAPGTMYIQLTGVAGDGGAYPWMQVLRIFEGGFSPNGNTGSNDADQPNFAPAYESQTGDTTLTADGTTYLAQQDRTSGAWLFDGKN